MMAKLMTDKTDNGLFQNRYRIPSSRASWHDYGGGVYFITICTSGRVCYFGEIADGEMRMSEIGRYTDACIRKIESLHTDISVPIYQIMPNHVHLVVIIEDITNLIKKETPQCDVSTAKKYASNLPQNNRIWDQPVETSYHGVSDNTNIRQASTHL